MGLCSSRQKIKNHRETPGEDDINGNPGLDYISELPDSILHHILSFLFIEDAIRTGVLSKRWASIWTKVPTIDFCHRTKRRRYEFLTFVSKTMKLHDAPKVEKLKLRFKHDLCFSKQIDEVILFAMQRNVEDLSLDFNCFQSYNPYKLPQSVYSNPSLRILNFGMCYFDPSKSIYWPSLTALSIGCTGLENAVIANIISGCPKLEFLKFTNCWGLLLCRKIIVRSMNLKKLVVERFTGSVMEISVPNIRSLSLFGRMRAPLFNLIDVSSLVEANLDFVMLTGYNYMDPGELLTVLLGQLGHVEKLTIGSWCLQVLRQCRMESLPSLSKLESLTAYIDIVEWNLQGLENFLQRNSHHLEKLTIHIMDFENTIVLEGENWASLATYFTDKVHGNLKSLEVIGFGERWFDPLNSYFFSRTLEDSLKNATRHEKMIVYGQADVSRTRRKRLKKFKGKNINELTHLIGNYSRVPTNSVGFYLKKIF